MSWKKMTPEQQAKWLTKQKEEIQQAKALLERFEKFTLRRLEHLQANKNRR